MSLWRTKASCLRQQYTVRKPAVGQVVYRGRHKAGVRVRRAPQTNGQVESANRILLRRLKRRLEKAKGTWAKKVPRIVWAYHTTPQSSTKETPFSLVYGSDAMIPVEIDESSPRFQSFVGQGV